MLDCIAVAISVMGFTPSVYKEENLVVACDSEKVKYSVKGSVTLCSLLLESNSGLFKAVIQ